jgi:hypothetical protein
MFPSGPCYRLSRFVSHVQHLFKEHKAKSNILCYQEKLMESLLEDPELLFPETDKGLGPCAVTYDQYVEDCLVHLQNQDCYRMLSEEDNALAAVKQVENEIKLWLQRHGKKIGKEHACKDANTKIPEFFDHLLARGHTQDKLLPIFARAEENANGYINLTPAEKEARRKKKLLESQSQIYFHLQFHPEDPPSRNIQQLWKEHVANPSGDVPLQWMENQRGDQVGFSKLVVAYNHTAGH